MNGIAIEYLGTVDVKANKVYRTSQLKAQVPRGADANMVKIIGDDISVGIDGTSLFPVSNGDESLLPKVCTVYMFNKDCRLVLGRYAWNSEDLNYTATEPTP